MLTGGTEKLQVDKASSFVGRNSLFTMGHDSLVIRDTSDDHARGVNDVLAKVNDGPEASQ